jgi:polyferredoxin
MEAMRGESMKTIRRGKRIDWTAWLRRLSQLGFSAYIITMSVIHNGSTETTPSTDALCPFGGVETLWRYITSGGTAYCPKTHPSNLVLFIGLMVGAVVAGGAFCGWVCPFGALEDALAWVRRKVRIPEARVPAKLDRALRFGRYLVLAGILFATISTVTLWFADYDPYRTIFSLGWLFEFNLATAWPAYSIALAIIVGSVFVPRLWCRYLCPLGGILGAVQRISPFKVRRDTTLCIDCGKCARSCPMHLPVDTKNAVNWDCIGCQKCTGVCPVDGALTSGLGTLKPLRPQGEEAAK